MGDPIRTVATGIDVAPIAWALAEHPELWNQNTARTASPDSPHHGVDDIWARFAAPGVDGSAPHDAVWYPAAHVLPVRDVVYDLARVFRADRIGGVLITRIPPGGMVQPHVDTGWHAGFYRKFGVQIASDPQQGFCFDGVCHVSKPGEVFEFDNAQRHWVVNGSKDAARITMIVCLRLEESCPGV